METPAALPVLLPHVIPFTLVLFRMAGLFLLAPVFTSTMIPGKFRALLAVALSIAAYPGVQAGAPAALPEVDLFGLVPMLAGEAMLGLCVGAIASLPLLSLELAGVVMGQSMGFGLARVYNPESDIDTDLLGQLLIMLATGVFVASGGLEALLRGIVTSFARIPPGGVWSAGGPDGGVLEVFLGVLTSGFDLALRVSMPVVGGTMLLVIVLGVIGKTMPQVNIMSVGFTVKIIAGLAALGLATAAVREAAGDALDQAVTASLSWLESLGHAAGGV